MEVVVVLVVLYLSSAKASDASVCFANQELSFFCDAKVFRNAKKSCEDKGSYLVKIDSANMTKVVNSMIDKVECGYTDDIFIGATATPHPDYPNNGSKRTWKWLDGSEVFLPGDNGYHNWLVICEMSTNGQPNDVGGHEDCVILYKATKKWKDTTCIDHEAEVKQYICQKIATVNLKVSQTLNEIRCEATTGSCKTHIEWRRDSKTVSASSSNDVYQIKNLTSSTLQYKNATIGNAGRYDCVGWIVGVEAISKSIAIDLSVNGTPEVIDIRSFECNTSLQIAWKPQFQSIGFLHRIDATASLTGNLTKVVEVTPTNAVLHRTEVTELNPSTEYYIKVVACKDVNNCLDEYATKKTGTTSQGNTYSVTNAVIQQDTDASFARCVVTWQWAHNITDTFRITSYYNSSETINTSTVEQTILTQNNLYFINSFPGREYNVEIQPVTNENYCSKPIKAVGSCIVKELGSNLVQIYFLAVMAMGVVIFILLIVIFSMAICMHNRSIESSQTPVQDSGDVHGYATVRNPEINEAACTDPTDNTAAQMTTLTSAGNFSYENIAQSSSSPYETISNKVTPEYEHC